MQTKGVCPVCNGATRVDASTNKYARVMYGFDPVTNTLPCRNCGGQYMSSKATGEVKLRKDGTPCEHKYKAYGAGRCLTKYVCTECSDEFMIDSSD